MTNGLRRNWRIWWLIWPACERRWRSENSGFARVGRSGHGAGSGCGLAHIWKEPRRVALQRIEPDKSVEHSRTDVGVGVPNGSWRKARNDTDREGQRDVHHGSREYGLGAGPHHWAPDLEV